MAQWERRDVLAIDACRGCGQQLACGGGCGAVAKNQAAHIAAPDCRPVRELLGLGCALHGKEPLREVQDADVPSATLPPR